MKCPAGNPETRKPETRKPETGNPETRKPGNVVWYTPTAAADGKPDPCEVTRHGYPAWTGFGCSGQIFATNFIIHAKVFSYLNSPGL